VVTWFSIEWKVNAWYRDVFVIHTRHNFYDLLGYGGEEEGLEK